MRSAVFLASWFIGILRIAFGGLGLGGALHRVREKLARAADADEVPRSMRLVQLRQRGEEFQPARPPAIPLAHRAGNEPDPGLDGADAGIESAMLGDQPFHVRQLPLELLADIP